LAASTVAVDDGCPSAVPVEIGCPETIKQKHFGVVMYTHQPWVSSIHFDLLADDHVNDAASAQVQNVPDADHD